VMRQLSTDEVEATWESMGQCGHATIITSEKKSCVMVIASSAVGEVSLRGHVKKDVGCIEGECLLDGTSGGTFELRGAESRAVEGASVLEQKQARRVDVIRKYAKQALHPHLLAWSPAPAVEACDAWLGLAPEFVEAHNAGTEEAWRKLLTEHLSGEVFSFPLFTDSFCDMLLEEVLNFYASGLPARRPNSMNNYGIILADMGLEPFVCRLQDMFRPLGRLLFPGPGSGWDAHHCFIVRYREGEDLGLDMHVDDSEVTFNVCLGLEFSGAGLQFCGMRGAPDHRRQRHTYQHVRGRCLVHLGKHRHGADDLTSGERLNLILWNQSSAYRGSAAFRAPDYLPEVGPPDLACLSYTHDRDYSSSKPLPAGKEAQAARAWCPPKHAEYAGFPSKGVCLKATGQVASLVKSFEG